MDWVFIFLHDLLTLLIVIEVDKGVQIILANFRKPKNLPINLAYIRRYGTLFQVRNQVFEFMVIRVLLERRDWHAIVQLESEGVNCIVHQQDVFEGDIFENS